ncbi:nucleotide exchange factor GrpE [Gimibacter soli]|uniref:Protein GrpE n=1 Tax=Gimibacter soli TaxID=3024400 RepID=A0AAF0BHS4_9PROT|nr:nucleotide exchange factor GrpE [Gimibacter soli]WCL54568.1 nucleotide exchange factor GrpE [Gimibacter soli]
MSAEDKASDLPENDIGIDAEAHAAAESESDTIDLTGAEDGPSEDELINQLQADLNEVKDRLLRTMAESENIRRRAEKDKADASAYAVTSFARDLLNVSDNLRRALSGLPESLDEAVKPVIEGVQMTERELINIFERHGIREVTPAVGDRFDPQQHQAMFEVPTAEHAPGSVVQLIAGGYMIKDRLLRPAMVGVSRAMDVHVDTKA